MIVTSVTPHFYYAAWRTSVERAIDRLMSGFEQRRGYPPGRNRVGGPAYARSSTKLSGPLQTLVDSGQIKLVASL